jgi:hypothetical protein
MDVRACAALEALGGERVAEESTPALPASASASGHSDGNG